MKAVLQRNSIFIGLSLILIVVLGLALIYIPKGELHLLLCDRHTPARDIFYRYYTRVGEWFPYVLAIALLLFSRIGDGVFAASGMLLSALTTQLFKFLINAPRPATWFAEHMPEVSLPLVDGVTLNYWFSFPSGHTTSFFALALVLSIILSRSSRISRISRILMQVALFALAALGAYSRIYLSQHFTFDVLAGIIVGNCITLLSYAVLQRYEHQKWYNYRLITKK